MENDIACAPDIGRTVSQLDSLGKPKVDDHLKPQIGMCFNTIEDAEFFYKTYGKAAGFDVRNSTTNFSTSKELIGKSFVCSKEGDSKNKSSETRRSGSIRTNCKALIRLKLHKEMDKWQVYKFIEVHNHSFISPTRTHLSRGNRKVTDVKKRLMNQFKEVNIPTSKQMAFFENASGGYNRIGCTETDVRNYERDLREEKRGHDAQMMLDHFKHQQESNSSFYYVYEVDDENRLTHCFWVDSVARMNYKHFGDVVSFDPTHNTNQYCLIFVPFVGVNQHWQTVFLGCGFIPNEDANSFIWLFNKWIEAMGHPPSGMITDQDLGICTAIKRVLPQIRHRYCVWHIMDKLSKELGGACKEKFLTPFKNNIWGSDNPSTFEAEWDAIIKENNLENHTWLKKIFTIREKWVPVYHKQHFWAGMSSSQRSEGMNALIKMHVSRKNSLHDFVVIFQRVLARQREKELTEDHHTIEKQPKLKTPWAMEKQMAQIYTRNIFAIFQEELQSSLLYITRLVKDDENETIYQLNYCGEVDKVRLVTYFKSMKMASCSCLMFEFKGIPCRHVLAYLKCSNFLELPDHYILRRWCQNVKRREIVLSDGNVLGDEATMNFASRFSELTCLANEVANEGLSSDAAYVLARNKMIETIKELQRLKINDDAENEEESQRNDGIKEISQVTIHEPSQAKTKGRPKGHRLKPLREIRKGRPRRCKSCGKRGQNHDSRNCPLKLTSGSTEHVDIDEESQDSENSFEEDDIISIP